MGIFDNIKGGVNRLFASQQQTEKEIIQNESSLSTLQNVNPDSRQTGETYRHWGLRICGIVGGSLSALHPYLHNVYNYIYKEQAKNVELQEQARKNTQAKIDQINTNIEETNHKISFIKDENETYQSKIETLKNERQEIKDEKGRINKDQRLKLIIGLWIIIPLTFYLFLFYSSTFYSAFFRNTDTMTDVMNAMFDSNALQNAAKGGVTQLLFVATAPIIFLGLGFCLHFFSVQKGVQKYVKMGAILLVTFMFDCILAYLIGKQLHNLGIIIGSVPRGDVYSISSAINDPNTWAVIFCGFIAYIIWGIVFDMTMSAYDKMDFNKTRLAEIIRDIKDIEDKIEENKILISNKESSIIQYKKDINTLMSKLGLETYIDYFIIETEMTNFYSGWITQMKVLSLPNSDLQQAQQIFDTTIQSLIKK